MVIDTRNMPADEYVSTIQPEAAHAASEFDNDKPAQLDDSAEMLGRLLIYAAGLVFGGVCFGVILAVAAR